MRRTLGSGLIFSLLLLLALITIPYKTLVAAASPVLRCARPNVLNASYCRDLEEEILDATVRILIQTWTLADDEKGYVVDVTGGHATVKDGQYLITHNHFSTPLSIREGEGLPGSSSAVFIYDAQGELLAQVPLSAFEVTVEEAEILVFAHQESDFFERLGVASATFKEGGWLPAKAGMEVAQIDWDGRTTRVDWTTVQAVQKTEGTPVLVLEDGVLSGASGGGIFWRGYHVANVWRFEERLSGDGELVDTISVVALNTAAVAQ